MMQKQRNILLCVAGLTPQIILETLYALTQKRGQRIDEIRVITTIAGRDTLKEVLLDAEQGKLIEFCKDYGLDRNSIKFDETTITLLRAPDGGMLEDIRTVKENEFAGDQICEIVRELTKDPNTRIHASAAGGRKTMSIYLTAAMQMFGRAQDALSHVLVSEAFETNRNFYYTPPVARMLKDRNNNEISTDEAKIYLAAIPFIRLRGTGEEWQRLTQEAHTYLEMVNKAQKYLDFLESEYDLEIELENNLVRVGDSIIALTPREMFFYVMFAEFRVELRDGDGIVSLIDLEYEDFDRTFRRITRASGNEDSVKNWEFDDDFKFLGAMLEQIKRKKADDIEAFREKFHQVISKIKNKFVKKGLPEGYRLVSNEFKSVSCYWIPLLPERIKFNDAASPASSI